MNFIRKILSILFERTTSKVNFVSVEEICKINYLSPSQTGLITGEKNNDLLKEQIREMMNKPDIAYLSKRLLPDQIDEHKNRKNIKAQDVVKATSLGDIIGYKYEFNEHDYKLAKTEPLPPQSSNYTDDTMLSIATMKAIIENDKEPNFRSAYIQAYNDNPSAGYGSSFATWATNQNDEGYNSMANGCAMRISFIPAYYENIEDVIKHTINSTMVTHNHVEGIKGSVVLAVCIWMALHHYNKEEIFEYCKKHYAYTSDTIDYFAYKNYVFDMNQCLSEVSNMPVRTSIFCPYAVPYVVKCFFETSSYEECMREILSRFGDTDTLCAMAGGLCFAYYGTTGFDIDKILLEHFVDI